MSMSDRINDTNAAPWVIEEIRKLEAECDARAAKLLEWDRLHSDATNAEYAVDEDGHVVGRCIDSDWLERGDEISDSTPTASLARLKAQWQAEALERKAKEFRRWANEQEGLYENRPPGAHLDFRSSYRELEREAKSLRRQAEED